MIAIFEDDAILLPELPAVPDALEDCDAPFDLVSLARRNPEGPLMGMRPLAAMAGCKAPGLRRAADRLQMGARKRIGFQKLVRMP